MNLSLIELMVKYDGDKHFENIHYKYRYFKIKIDKMNLPPDEYDAAIKKLCELIGY